MRMRLDLVPEPPHSWIFLAADFNERESPSLLRIDGVLQCAEVLLVFVDTARDNRNCVRHGLLSRCLQDGRHKRRTHPVCTYCRIRRGGLQKPLTRERIVYGSTSTRERIQASSRTSTSTSVSCGHG